MTPETDIRDIKGLIPIPLLPWWAWCLIVLGLLALAGLAWWLWRRRRRDELEDAPVRVQLSPYDRARRELDDVRAADLIEHGAPEPFYTRLSDVVRQYLEGRFWIRAPERTTEEFLQDAANLARLSADHRALLAGFLAESDLVKFARLEPAPADRRRAFEAAETFVEQTRPADEAQEGSADR